MNELIIQPATPERWSDLERLFGPRGACGGCWCMHWRKPRGEYTRDKGDANRDDLRALVLAGEIPGVLAYHDDVPIGWCAVGPREAYPTLERSRILRRVDDEPVWSIVCLFVDRQHRRQGVTIQLIAEAVRWAGSQGARIVEAYPVEPKRPDMPPVFAFTGIAAAFRRAGFHEVACRSETRPIMRRATDLTSLGD